MFIGEGVLFVGEEGSEEDGCTHGFRDFRRKQGKVMQNACFFVSFKTTYASGSYANIGD
jgi:hypothetical protein